MHTMGSTKHRPLLSALGLRAAWWLGLTALGCGAEPPTLEPPEDTLAQGASSAQPMQDAGGPRLPLIEVSPRGTACPAGASKTTVSRDGTTLTTTFSEFLSQITETQSIAVQDCLLTVRLRSDVPLTYAVTSLRVQGYAYLEPGVRAFHAMKHYAAGAPNPMDELRTDLTGPYDDIYRLEAIIPDEDTAWIPCGYDRSITISHRMLLRSNPRGKIGYLSLTAIETSTPPKHTIGLKWRPCQDTRRDASTPAAVDASASLDAGAP